MAWHPQFLSAYIDCTHAIMYAEGALSPCLRHYVAILGASRHNCNYLVALQENLFAASMIYDSSHSNMESSEFSSTQLRWVQEKGVEFEGVPKKIRKLTTLCALMAHQPWLITKDHIEVLEAFFSFFSS